MPKSVVLAKLYVSPWEAIGLGLYFIVAGLAILKWWQPMARWMGRNCTWGSSQRTIEWYFGTQDDPKRWFMRVFGGSGVAAGLLMVILGIAG